MFFHQNFNLGYKRSLNTDIRIICLNYFLTWFLRREHFSDILFLFFTNFVISLPAKFTWTTISYHSATILCSCFRTRYYLLFYFINKRISITCYFFVNITHLQEILKYLEHINQNIYGCLIFLTSIA